MVVVITGVVGSDAHLGVVGGVLVGMNVVVVDVVVEMVVVGEVLEGETVGVVPRWRGSAMIGWGYPVVVHCWAIEGWARVGARAMGAVRGGRGYGEERMLEQR